MPGSIFRPLIQSLTTLSSIAQDLVHLLVLVSRSRRALAAENLFLRKQLALFQERKVNKAPVKTKPRVMVFSDLAARGLKFRQLHLNIIDGSKALRAGVRRYRGESSPILRCQLHKRRNIVRHFPALTRTVVQFVFSFVRAGGFRSARGCVN